MNPLYALWLGLRTVVFYTGYGLSTLLVGTAAQLFRPVLPRRWVQGWVLGWTHFAVWWLGVTCGIRVLIQGREHLPDRPCVVLANHQSSLETIVLQYLCWPVSTTLKRELLNIPGFGWGMRLLDPIAIDRGAPRDAIRQLMEQGLQRLESGHSLLIFPEGTRQAPGEHGKYARGGAGLACAAQVPVVAIAHNCGARWPARRFLKQPGTATFIISPPLVTVARTPKDVTDEARTWIDAQLQRIDPPAPSP